MNDEKRTLHQMINHVRHQLGDNAFRIQLVQLHRQGQLRRNLYPACDSQLWYHLRQLFRDECGIDIDRWPGRAA